MPSLWITDTGEVLSVPLGSSHEDMAGDLGGSQGEMLSSGWIRVTGAPRSGWDLEVHDIRILRTIKTIEDFLYGAGAGAKEVRIESAKPKRVYFSVRGDDGESFQEAVERKLNRALEHPEMLGNPKRRRRR